MRFSPGPLLPALSGGFSAVVAESLRRGETSPLKDGKGRRRSDRRKPISSTIVDGGLRNRPGEAREVEYDSDGAVEENESPFAGRLNPTTGETIPTSPSTPALALAQGGNTDQNAADDAANLSRLRSLSDSWSGPAWLGGVLHKPTQRQSQENGSSVHKDNASSGDKQRED